MADVTKSESSEEEKKVKLVRNAADLQRLKLEKLMKQTDKPVYIPDRPKEKKLPPPPEFIRNTWGSSAGAGSGDFHVYRGVRRREYARQKFLTEKLDKETKDIEYKKKVEENIKNAEDRTLKKRQKRLKKKQKTKKVKTTKNADSSSEGDSDEVDEADDEQVVMPEGNSEQKTSQSDQAITVSNIGGEQPSNET